MREMYEIPQRSLHPSILSTHSFTVPTRAWGEFRAWSAVVPKAEPPRRLGNESRR